MRRRGVGAQVGVLDVGFDVDVGRFEVVHGILEFVFDAVGESVGGVDHEVRAGGDPDLAAETVAFPPDLD